VNKMKQESNLTKFFISYLLKASDNGARVAKADPQTAARYARMKTAPPPIIVDSTNKVLDGCHRIAAAILRGEDEIWALKKATQNFD